MQIDWAFHTINELQLTMAVAEVNGYRDNESGNINGSSVHYADPCLLGASRFL